MPRRRPPFPIAPFVWMAVVILLYFTFRGCAEKAVLNHATQTFFPGMVTPTPTPAKR